MSVLFSSVPRALHSALPMHSVCSVNEPKGFLLWILKDLFHDHFSSYSQLDLSVPTYLLPTTKLLGLIKGLLEELSSQL